MREIDKALDDILTIRHQLADPHRVPRLRPATLAATGGRRSPPPSWKRCGSTRPTARPLAFFGGWVATAIVSAALIGIEMRARSHRRHSGLADAMINRRSNNCPCRSGRRRPAGAGECRPRIFGCCRASGRCW